MDAIKQLVLIRDSSPQSNTLPCSILGCYTAMCIKVNLWIEQLAQTTGLVLMCEINKVRRQRGDLSRRYRRVKGGRVGKQKPRPARERDSSEALLKRIRAMALASWTVEEIATDCNLNSSGTSAWQGVMPPKDLAPGSAALGNTLSVEFSELRVKSPQASEWRCPWNCRCIRERKWDLELGSMAIWAQI
ncbi:hypothetical protein B0T26DRAFT_681641 [Lasiosphaeria miniovina]|uniref:Uncharacterized protein n=1 Tax=Lasiosphaeria miniovina TaxID=1954250 RepID=A0AA39ZUN1_9PEZI|nr:uncharacterized protein B0T26DRAFT_681641 [Lasiosphaeria miniovina]KAK0704027.1 hypothetical protein B0T26DRAFT_681641 [Lasiosphaeria miniovina]